MCKHLPHGHGWSDLCPSCACLMGKSSAFPGPCWYPTKLPVGRLGSKGSGHGPFCQVAACSPLEQCRVVHRPWGCLEPTASKADDWSPHGQWGSFRWTRTSTVRTKSTRGLCPTPLASLPSHWEGVWESKMVRSVEGRARLDTCSQN